MEYAYKELGNAIYDLSDVEYEYMSEREKEYARKLYNHCKEFIRKMQDEGIEEIEEEVIISLNKLNLNKPHNIT